jgi:hypothetical protein
MIRKTLFLFKKILSYVLYKTVAAPQKNLYTAFHRPRVADSHPAQQGRMISTPIFEEQT